MPRSIITIFSLYVLALLSGCDTLHPLQVVPHIEVIAKPSKQLYCAPPLIWTVRERSNQWQAICEEIGYSPPRPLNPYKPEGEEFKQLPPFREVSLVTQVFCRCPAVWEIRNDPKGEEGTSKVAAICRLPERAMLGWYSWGGWWAYPGFGMYRY